MSKASNIDNLAELHARQAEVKEQKKAAKKGLFDSLAQTPGKLTQFAYEDLALPVMGIGLAVYVGYRLLRSDKRQQNSLPQAAPEPQHLPPAVIAERPPASYTPPVRAPRPSTPPQPEVPVASVAKSGLNLAAIISVGKILIPAAQAVMSAVQDHKAQQTNMSVEE